MANIRVQTIQHKSVITAIEQDGRYVLDPQYVCYELKNEPEHRRLVLAAYDWLAQNMPAVSAKPDDARYPIWVTLGEGNSYPEGDESVTIDLSVPEEELCVISVARWSAILDYRYLPADEADASRHYKMLSAYGISDAKACMTNFYPDIKREIMNSWPRVFEVTPGETCYGLIWEIREDMILR